MGQIVTVICVMLKSVARPSYDARGSSHSNVVVQSLEKQAATHAAFLMARFWTQFDTNDRYARIHPQPGLKSDGGHGNS